MASELVRQLIDAGVHFGHRVSRWNPKMRPYIYGRRNLIHIIDIRETIKGLLRAKRFLTRVVSEGADVLFVGTKRQARAVIEHHARRLGMPYVTERWLGGTLTNFSTIRSRLSRLEELEELERSGQLASYSKKMVAILTRERNKIRRNLEGIRNMNRLPGALVVVDVRREHNAVKEARKLGIPTVCLIDTDSDPDYADVPIPGNDDAIRSIELIVSHLADAVEEGLKARTAAPPETAEEAPRRLRRPAPAPAPTPDLNQPVSEEEQMAEWAAQVSGEPADEATSSPSPTTDSVPAATGSTDATRDPANSGQDQSQG